MMHLIITNHHLESDSGGLQCDIENDLHRLSGQLVNSITKCAVGVQQQGEINGGCHNTLTIDLDSKNPLSYLGNLFFDFSDQLFIHLQWYYHKRNILPLQPPRRFWFPAIPRYFLPHKLLGNTRQKFTITPFVFVIQTMKFVSFTTNKRQSLIFFWK